MKRDFENQDGARSPEEHFAEREQSGHMRNGMNGDNTSNHVDPRAADSQLMRLRPAEMRPGDNSFRYRYTEDEGGEGLDLRQVLTLLRRRRKILLATFFTVVAAGTLFTWLSRPIYQATTQILVNTSASGGSGADAFTDLLGDKRARSLDTQMAVLKSGPVMQGALARLSPEHQKAAQEFFNVAVNPLTTTDVLVVDVSSYNPQTAAAIGNALGAEYIQKSKEQNQERVRVATKFVSEQREMVDKDLDTTRRQLREFKQRHNIVNLGPESEARVGELGQNQAELRAAQTELLSNRAQLAQLRALAATMAPSHVIPTIRRRPTVEALQGQITNLEIQRVAALEEYVPESDEVQRIEGQLTALRRRLSNEAVTEVVGSTRVIDPVRQGLMAKISEAQAQIWAQEARIPALTKGVEGMRAQMKTLPQREYELSKINSELATLQKTFETLNEQYVTLRINAEGQLASASIMSPAAVPTAPISPRVGRNILMSIALGLMLAIALATLTDRLDDRVHSEEDAESASRLPVLAHIPFMQDKDKQSLIGHSGNSALLESYRMLRTNIEFSAVDEPVRSLVVTSSQPGEGKSTTSADLAIVMALDGKKVILVDCDLRRPSLHRLFALPNRVGFTSVVAGQSSLEDALQPTKIPGLFVLTSGPVPPNPPEVLNSKAGRAVFAQVAQQADFAVLDTPPALVMADAQIVASIADAAMLVISFKEAGKREIARTSELISQTGTKVLGSVLNKLTDEVDGYYGYYGYKNRYYGRYLDAADGNQTESLTEALKRADDSSGNGTAIAVADQQPGPTSEQTPPNGSA